MQWVVQGTITSRRGQVEHRELACDGGISGNKALDWRMGEGVQSVEGRVQGCVHIASRDVDAPNEIHKLQPTMHEEQVTLSCRGEETAGQE
jgi:hypothetical protein